MLGFKKGRAFEWITSAFPATVVKIKNTPKLERDLFKAVVTNASEERIFFGDRLFCKCQRERLLSPPSEAAVNRLQSGARYWGFQGNRSGISFISVQIGRSEHELY